MSWTKLLLTLALVALFAYHIGSKNAALKRNSSFFNKEKAPQETYSYSGKVTESGHVSNPPGTCPKGQAMTFIGCMPAIPDPRKKGKKWSLKF